MKIKRLLAAILSALMITSCMSFVAGAEEVETNGIIKEFVLAKSQDLNPGVENSKSVTKLYDAVSNTAYVRVTPNTGNVSVYVNHGGASVTFTEEQAKADTNYLVYYARTNLDNDAETDGVQMPAPSAMLYGTTWNTKPDSYNDALTQVTEGFASTITDEWQKFCFKITSKITKDETEYLLTKWNQVAFGPVGLRAVMDGDKMYLLSDNPYYDVAGYAVVDSLEAAEAYDFTTEASVSGINFDLNYEGAPELTSAPAENPTREGINFSGWATSPNGDIIATDLTTIPGIPAADTTYYAIWESATIIFNRRNGAKDAAVSSVNVALGTAIPFPENPTYQNHTFLGWSTEKNNKDKIVDTATAVVTDEMVENGMTYYAVWESTHDSTQPVFFVTAQHNAKTMVNENCVGEIRYDAENDIVYKHFSPNTSKLIAGSCNMYGLGNKSFTTDADKLYMVYYIRTNILGSKPYVGIYSTTNKDGTNGSFSQTPNFTYTEELQDKWTKVIIELAGMSELGICTHIDFSAVGQNKKVTEANYYDISAIAIFDNQEAANNFDIVEASKIDNVTLTFNTHGGSAVEPITVKSGAFVQETIEIPVPTKENYTFKGWATELHGTALASVTNPTADTTYYAVWEMADPEEVSDKLYLSTNGCDVCNNGFSAKYPVKTLKKAQEILNANSSVNTIVVVDTYKKSDESSASVDNFAKGINRKLYITGLASDSIFDMRYFDASNAQKDSHFRIGTDVEFKNITIIGSAKDGGFMSMGYELTFGENIVISGGQNVGILHYNAQLKDNAVVNLLSGTYNRIDLAVQSGQTYKGTSTINIGGTAKTKITNGHGWKGEQSVYGINNVNINGGEVTSIQFSATADTAVTNYAGLRYFTINGGTVGDIYTTGSSVSKKYDNTERKASARAGVTVFEINGGTVGKIKLGTNKQTGAADPDDATRVVILNNGMNATVEDTGAIVIKTSGGTLKAVTNAYGADGKPTYGSWDKVTADWGKAIKLTGYSYTTDAANKYININGTNYQLSDFTNIDEATLAEEVTVLIPANLFEAGKTNTAVFSETPVYTVTWKNGEEIIGTENVAGGSTLTAPEIAIAPDKEYYKYNVVWTSDVEGFDIETYTVSEDITVNAEIVPAEDCKMPKSEGIQYSAFSQVNNVTGVFTSAVDTIDGIEAVKVIPTADGSIAINLEGGGKYPYNYSTGAKTDVVDPSIYDYAVYKYYYVPGTNTETRTFHIWYQKHPWQTCPDPVIDTITVDMEAGKWTYIVDKLDRDDGQKPAISQQFHLRPMNTVAAKDLAANGEYIYIDGMQIFSYEPTVATVTFKAENGTVLYAIDALNSEAVTYNGTAPTKTGYTFKGWALENTTEVVDTFTFANDTTLVPVFEEDEQEEPFPEEPTYKTYGNYNAANGTYTVELKIAGTKANIGSFGFRFPAEYMTLTNVVANTAAGVALLAEEASDVAQPSPIFVKDTANGYYANTWTAELAEGYGYIDATAEEITIVTFTFAMTAQQRTAFEAVLANDYKFGEYVIANADAKYHNGTNYLVAPYTPDLSTNKEAVVYASHKDEVTESESVSMALKVNFIADKGSEGTSLATVRVDDGAAIVIEQAGNTNSVNYTIADLEAGKKYTIYVEKNGYIAGECEVTVKAGVNTLEMTLIPGDIKGAATAVCGDGTVNLDDFVRLIRAFDSAASKEFKANVDINEDGSVTVSDLGYIKSNFNCTSEDVEITFNGQKIVPGIGE